MHSDQVREHAGFSVDSGTTRLLRDGVEVGSSGASGFVAADLPAEPATYRLETASERTNSPFSTRQTAAWTFRSSRTTGPQPLPLMLLRFTPRLDDLNRAPAGRRFEVPVAVDAQPGAGSGPVKVTVEASYDDGTTWQSAPITGPAHRTAVLTHPAKPGFVSLRATATDASGNKVEQTVIHAYQLR